MAYLRVGLTGGIAAGKSTVAAWLRDAGYAVIDADRIVADLYRPGADGARAVADLFGPTLLDGAGQVDHQRLAHRIFQDPAARGRLEAVIHPLVKKRFEEFADQTTGVVVLEAPLLIEAGFAPDLDLVITVEAKVRTRIERAVTRGLDPEDARRRLAAQTDENTRTAVAHRTLRNDGSLDELRLQVESLIAEIDERIANGR